MNKKELHKQKVKGCKNSSLRVGNLVLYLASGHTSTYSFTLSISPSTA